MSVIVAATSFLEAQTLADPAEALVLHLLHLGIGIIFFLVQKGIQIFKFSEDLGLFLIRRIESQSLLLAPLVS